MISGSGRVSAVEEDAARNTLRKLAGALKIIFAIGAGITLGGVGGWITALLSGWIQINC